MGYTDKGTTHTVMSWFEQQPRDFSLLPLPFDRHLLLYMATDIRALFCCVNKKINGVMSVYVTKCGTQS